MTCRLCKQLIISADPHPAKILKYFEQHIATHHQEQMTELIYQASAIMGWLTARIFILNGATATAHEDMTNRMIRLSASIKGEIDEAKQAQLAKVVKAHFDEEDPPHQPPGQPKLRR